MKKKSIICFLAVLILLSVGCSKNSDDSTNFEHDSDQNGENDTDQTENSDNDNIQDPDGYDDDIADPDNDPNNDTGHDPADDSDIYAPDNDTDASDPDNDDNDNAEQNDNDTDEQSDDYDNIPVDPEKPVAFGNICTGQNKCYSENSEIACPDEGTPFYGQDFQYAKLGKCIPQSFSVKGSGEEQTVFDNNLKLEWQQKIPEGEYDWPAADDYCKNLDYSGYNDWRLPTPQELLSIVDNGKSDPAVNTEYFPETSDEWFWTSADFVSTENYDADKAWFVRFDKGFLSHKNKTKSERMHVRCVRGETLQHGTFSVETFENQEVVKDSLTGLMWQTRQFKDNTDEISKFEDSLSYCENLEYAGFSDWRLPNKNELASLADYDKYHPASSFPEMTNRSFRTSTSDAKNIGNAWYVTFYEGIVNFEGKETGTFVRCVRN